jgi:hypothetical protein
LLYFADVFEQVVYSDNFYIFLQSLPLYVILLACLAYELSVTELMLLARAALRVQLSARYIIYNAIFKIYIYSVMVIFFLQFLTSYIRTVTSVKPEISDYVLAGFYLLTGTLIGISSIHFLCEMKRNFGTGTFLEAKHNVLIIVITILVGFVFTIGVMIGYGTDRL